MTGAASVPLAVAELNDRFRSLSRRSRGIPGTTLVTRGVAALGLAAQMQILAAVRAFAAFTEDNDPYGEHDFGAIDHPAAGRVFWKIDVYADESCQWGSPHPDDPACSYRVLTVFLAEEY